MNENVKQNHGELNDEQCEKINQFLLHNDLSDAQDVHVISMSEDMKEGEAYILYPEYMVIRTKNTYKTKLHSEKMGLDVDHTNTEDFCSNILKGSITSINLYRVTSCDCEECLSKIVKGEKEPQSEEYIVQICTTSRPYNILVEDKEEASFLQDHFTNWILKRGPFKYKQGVYHKKIKK